MSWWERFLFRDRGIIPTKKLVLFMLAFSGFLFITAFLGVSWTFIFIINVVVFLVSLIDLAYIPKRKDLHVERIIPSELERGLAYDVKVVVKNDSDHSMNYRFIDGIPQSFMRPFPFIGAAKAMSQEEATYETKAPVRGKYEINKLYFRYSSGFGLWEKQTSFHLEETVKVIPDLSSVKDYLKNAQQYLLHEGVKIRKQNSGVGEFAKVRNYVVGDDPRKINWRQTAKLQEVMTNEYEPERGKYITILVDCGRMMGAELKESNRLEKALEAALTVTAAALKNGDYVSVVAFSKEVKVYVPPAKGMDHLQTILQAIYHLQVDPVESNYGAVLNYLQSVQNKRSLLLLFSDIQTFLYEDSTLAYLQRLRKRHMFLMIGIEDEMLREKVKSAPDEVRSAMVKSIAQQQLLFIMREKNRWQKQGLHMLEAKGEKLASTAVSHYIDTMNRGLL
ncbi:DUF58 domain-containing protein [Bacillus alkalicola]|uniref:DUF58 domain-containing protein n=2 Tax=Bacillales TaxID=1385 RepID=A0ABS6JUY2_9BACI|nr:DUF58 domain-containing protein [Bacillus alkalicola]